MRSEVRALVFLGLSTLILARPAAAQAGIPDTLGDRYRWLEEVHGERAMAWVRAENAKTVAVLEKDPRYAGIYRSALAMAQSADRIPYASFLGGALYNFWQDSAHVRGIWRKTTLTSYRTRSPLWTTVLDLDSLARAENANWVWNGAICAAPAERRCLLQLSDGGEDAVTIREFDLTSRAFVKGGFVLPKGKQRVAWAGTDTLLVSRAWTGADVTTSGYPFIVKRLARGQPIDQAVEIFRGAASDGGYGVTPSTLVDGQGRRVSFVARPLTTFEAEVYVLTKEEGGRHTPFFKGYRPQFYFRTTDVTGACELPAGVEMVMPGDNIKMVVTLISPIAMEQGLRFAIREGGRTVGAGVVAKIVE